MRHARRLLGQAQDEKKAVAGFAAIIKTAAGIAEGDA